MRAHWRYLLYVLRHKYHVARGGRLFKVPLWRLVKHDWSKFLRVEWFPYVDRFYGDECHNQGDFDRAWLHHQHWNDHHWQHWVLRNDDSPTIDVVQLEMPAAAAREMVADWYGAGHAINGTDDLVEWYAKNAGKMALHQETRSLVSRLVAEHAEASRHPSARQQASEAA